MHIPFSGEAPEVQAGEVSKVTASSSEPAPEVCLPGHTLPRSCLRFPDHCLQQTEAALLFLR